MPRYTPSSSDSPLDLPRFREGTDSVISASTSRSRNPNRYAGTPGSAWSPATFYPSTVYDSPAPFPPPPLPSTGTSKLQTYLNRRPPPLDFTELFVLQDQPRDDIPVLSLTPSPLPTGSLGFRVREDPFASAFNLHGHSEGGSKRRASPALSDRSSPAEIVDAPRKTARFSVAPVSAWLSTVGRGLGLADVDKSRARKVVSREMRKLEGDRRALDAWDREREGDDERERIWKGVGGPALDAVAAELDLKPWSPLEIKEKKDTWTFFRRGEKGGGGDAGPGRSGAVIADDHQARRKKTRRNILIIVAIVVVLLLAGIGVFVYELHHKSFSKPATTTVTATQTITSGSSTYLQTMTSTSTTSISATKTSSSSAAASSSAAPVINLASCLKDFPPSNGTSYCSTCNTFLSTVTNDWTSSDGTTGVGQALQWCGLWAMFEETDSAQSTLGWFKGSGSALADVCGWNGITCDQDEKVIQLNLTYPGVPSTLPSAIGNLVSLQTLYVSGSTVASVPSGSLPSTIYSLTNLTSLSLHNTVISSAIPNSAFSSSSKLQSLVLVGNPGLGSSLPSGLAGTGLTSLIVQGQSLSGNPIGSLPLSLNYLDISSNSLSSLSSLSSLISLTTLLATSNSLTSLPDSFPSTLATLNLAQNSALTGSLPSSLCDSRALTKCDVSNTQLKGNINTSTTTGNTTNTITECGVCTF